MNERERERERGRERETFFLKLVFRMWESCRIENHKKFKSNFFTIAILPSVLMSFKSKKEVVNMKYSTPLKKIPFSRRV